MAICSPARAPISSISLSAGIKRPFDFIIFGSFTWKQEVDGENLSNLFSLGWSPLNPSGSGRTGPLGAETKRKKEEENKDSREYKQNYHKNTLGNNCEKVFHLSWLSETLYLFASVSLLQLFP